MIDKLRAEEQPLPEQRPGQARTMTLIVTDPAECGHWYSPDAVRELMSQAAKLEAAEKDATMLRRFAKAVMDAWPEGDLDGGDLQAIAVAHRLLEPETRHAPCSEDGCACAEYADETEWAAGVICYLHTALLTGEARAKEPHDMCADAVKATAQRCVDICKQRFMGDNNREDMEARRCANAIAAEFGLTK